MFCGECGTKNKSGAQFCENCGAKLQTPKKEVTVKEKKPMTKKQKMTAGIIAVVAVLVIGLFVFLGNLTSPKTIAEKLFKASVDYDFDTIYEYLDVEDSNFTSKEMFKKVMAKDADEDNKPVLVNYTVGNSVLSDDKMSTTVTITYMLKDEDESDTMDIKLVKSKDKKWLFFDNWKVNVNGVSVTKNYEIKVLKGSKVKLEDIELTQQYLDSEKSSSDYDVYVIPSIFEAKYDIVVTLPIGVESKDTIRVYDGSKYTYRLSLSDLSEEVKENLKTASKTSLQTLYDGVKDGKSFDDISSSFTYDNADLSKLKKAYSNLVSGIGTSQKLTSITFKEITLSSLDIDSNGKLEVYLKATFDYSISYESGDETKTHDSDDYDYVYLTFDYVDGTYHLVNASSLNTYFSRYY
ncbi:MAG: zinc-ribbon domain-containing protein [Tenericutes bacterium]|nr:zinc-ribbon domain-containing protein [Mycoplasmatota bacterium]